MRVARGASIRDEAVALYIYIYRGWLETHLVELACKTTLPVNVRAVCWVWQAQTKKHSLDIQTVVAAEYRCTLWCCRWCVSVRVTDVPSNRSRSLDSRKYAVWRDERGALSGEAWSLVACLFVTIA